MDSLTPKSVSPIVQNKYETYGRTDRRTNTTSRRDAHCVVASKNQMGMILDGEAVNIRYMMKDTA